MHILRFGIFAIDTQTRVLTRSGAALHIEPKPLDLLLYLIAHRDRVISKRELLDTLWPDTFVSEGALFSAITAARRAIDGADAEITNVHGRGYRFVGAFSEEGTPAAGAAAADIAGTPQNATAAAFVGRQSEMARLETVLDTAQSGAGQCILVFGDAGIGKTRLTAELAAVARARGHSVLVGRCYDGAGAPAFWPWAQLIRGYAASNSTAAIERAIGSGASDIAQMVPSIGERLVNMTPAAAASDYARFRLFDSVATFLSNVARESGMLLILDDCHWADESSILLLQFLVREIVTVPMLIVCTYRDSELGRDHPLSVAINSLQRETNCHAIKVSRLADDEARELVAHALDAPALAAAVEQIACLGEGNPFYLLELSRSRQQQPAASNAETTSSEGALKPTQGIRALVRRRTACLGESGQATLAAAAVIGREFDLYLLSRITPLHADEIMSAVDAAVHAELVVPVPQLTGRYAFGHALTRETLYDELGALQRSQLHQRIAAALKEEPSEDDSYLVSQLAHHSECAIAAAGNESERAERTRDAARYRQQAAAQAASTRAFEAAAIGFERAVALLDTLTPREESWCGELLLQAGDAYTQADDFKNMTRVFRRAADIADRHAQHERYAHAVVGMITSTVGHSLISDETTIELLEGALARLDHSDSARRANVLGRLAFLLYYHPQSDASIERRDVLCSESIAIARRLGHPALLSWTLGEARWACWRPQNLTWRRQISNEAVETARQAGREDLEVEGLFFLVNDNIEACDINTLDTDLATIERLSRRVPRPWQRWVASYLPVTRSLLVGDLQAVEGLITQTLTVGIVSDELKQAVLYAQMANLLAAQGRFSALAAAVDSVPAGNSGIDASRALAYSEDSRHKEASHILDRLVAPGCVLHDYTYLTSMSSLAHAAARIGAMDHAARLYDVLLPYEHRCVIGGIGLMVVGALARYLGLLAATLGERTKAVRHFEVALQHNQAMRARPWEAWTQYDYGNFLATGNAADKRRAQTLFATAATTAEEIDMAGLRERLQAR